MGLSRQSIVLVLTTKQETNNTQKHKITKSVTNKLALVKKTHKNMQEKTKPKPTNPSSLARAAHTSVHINEYNCGTQYSTEQF